MLADRQMTGDLRHVNNYLVVIILSLSFFRFRICGRASCDFSPRGLTYHLSVQILVRLILNQQSLGDPEPRAKANGRAQTFRIH